MKDIFEFLRGHADFRIMLEIGAALGDSTPYILKSVDWKGGSYFAFEPDPRHIETFKNSEVYHSAGLVFVPAAVGSQTGEQTFYPSDGEDSNTHYQHWLSGSLKKPAEHLWRCPWVKFDREIKVRVVELDKFLWPFGFEKIDFIWCDAQGAEDHIIQKAQDTLRKTRFFYTEYYEYKMYEGQMGSEEIQRRLPGKWRVVEKWETDILFENIT